jgi:tetratricopeptide (TPR) repeat protein
MNTLTATDLQEVQRLYESGLYLQAYERSRELGTLESWRGVDGRILAGRLANNLGAGRLGTVLHWLAYREHPDSAIAACYCARTVLQRMGPYFALRWMERHEPKRIDGDRSMLGEWLGMRAYCHGALRDRKRADDEIARAYDAAPDLVWLAVEHCALLETTDRYDEALEVIQGALEKRPNYRPAVQSCARLLVLAGRDDEALSLMQSAAEHVESGSLHCQLGSVLRQQQRLDDARQQYEIGASKMPLMDQEAGGAWLARIRSDLASACGDADEALRLLKMIPDRHKGYFHKQVQASLENRPADAKRKRLDVAFIRQHYRTCAPATLAMLAKYWDEPAEHLEIADAICFDGTQYHAERQWAEGQGYETAEFSLDWPTATALIDRGVPFTLSTVEPGNGHLQAVIGYDASRQVLLLRDPFYPSVGEILAKSLPKRYGAFGPRGMVMVPKDKRDLLDGVDLPDRELWDHSHALRCALIDHRRDEAVQSLAEMQAIDADATVTLNAELSLADYDNAADTRDRLVKTLIDRYPDCPAMVPRRLSCLSEQGLRHERLELLRNACEQDDASSLLKLRLADELAQDARDHGRASWELRRLIRMGYQNGEAYDSLGSLYWTLGRRDDAIELYRIAACLEDKREYHAMTLFRAQRYRRKEQETLELLRERFDRLGDKDAGPAKTLYEAHRMMARADLGFTILEEAIERRPDDGDLLLFASGEMSAYGMFDRAEALLEKAEPRARPDSWRFTAASVAEDNGKVEEARDHMQAVIDTAPLNIAAQRRWARLTHRCDGEARVLEHLRAMVDRFPHHWDLQQMLYFELRDSDPPASLVLLRKMLETLPNNAWAWRELGFSLVELPDGIDEAREAARRAKELDPTDYTTYHLLGRVAERAGQTEAASEAYRRALHFNPDAAYAIERLINMPQSIDARREALAFIAEQLAEQVTLGDGLLTFQEHAGRGYSADEVLAVLHQAVKERADLWHSWAALIDQLLLADRSDEALKAAEEATERFPLIPTMWLRRSEVHRVRLEDDALVRCLEETLRISPDQSRAVHRLMSAYQNAGQHDKAEEVVRRAMDRSPRSAGYHGRLAEVLWLRGEHDEALASIERAVRLSPDYSWAWGQFMDWSARLGRADDPGDVARSLTQENPTDASLWMTLADVLHRREDADERLAALNRSIELNPLNSDAHDLKAELLTRAHRFDEALAACDPPAMEGRPTINLRGRACWVTYERGEHDRAIESLWKIVDDEPQYIWALKTLISWCGDKDDTDGQIKAAGMLIAADPNDHVALGYRAWAKLRQSEAQSIPSQDRDRLIDEAKGDLERALALEPDYDFAADRLFNLHLDAKDTDRAAKTLERTAAFLNKETRLSRELALACARGEKPEAAKLLDELCRTETENSSVFGYAYEHADKIGLAEPTFAALVQDPETNPRIAEQVIRADLTKRSWKQGAKTLKKLRHRPEAWDHGANILFNTIGDAASSDLQPFTKQVYRRNRKRILATKLARGAAMYALACVNLDRQVIELFGDWRRRTDLEPWMLCNLVNALLARGRIAEAREAGRHALQLPPDHSMAFHLVDLAHCEALIGRLEDAKQALDSVALVHLNPQYQFEHHLAAALIAARENDPLGQGVAQAKAQLNAAYKLNRGFVQNIGARRSHRRIVWAIIKRSGPLSFFKLLPNLLKS